MLPSVRFSVAFLKFMLPPVLPPVASTTVLFHVASRALFRGLPENNVATRFAPVASTTVLFHVASRALFRDLPEIQVARRVALTASLGLPLSLIASRLASCCPYASCSKLMFGGSGAGIINSFVN